MIDWTKVNPNYLLLAGVALCAIMAGGTIFLWAVGDKSDAAAFVGIMLPLVMAVWGVKQTQATSVCASASKKADAAIAQNETIIAKVDAVKRMVNGSDHA